LVQLNQISKENLNTQTIRSKVCTICQRYITLKKVKKQKTKKKIKSPFHCPKGDGFRSKFHKLHFRPSKVLNFKFQIKREKSVAGEGISSSSSWKEPEMRHCSSKGGDEVQNGGESTWMG
jgi:hypothetical protein